MPNSRSFPQQELTEAAKTCHSPRRLSRIKVIIAKQHHLLRSNSTDGHDLGIYCEATTCDDDLWRI
jgi:hypothetical protein